MPCFPAPEPRLTVELRDAPIRAAIEAICNAARTQYTIAPDVAGVVTVRRTTQPLRKLLTLLLSQATREAEWTEEKDVFIVRAKNGGRDRSGEFVRTMERVALDGQKKQSRQPGQPLARLAGYVAGGRELEGIVELGLLPDSVVRIVQSGKEMPASTGIDPATLTVVRLTERGAWLKPSAGDVIQAPFAGFEYYRS
jgi:hypothetical protein